MPTTTQRRELRELADSVRGTVLGPGDQGYDEARRVWNGAVDRRPAAIVRCTGTADVVAAVSFARREGLLTAVRGGGHNVAGNAVCDDGLVVDLSPMRGVRVDPGKRTARAQGGTTWGEFDRETQLFSLATTGGIVSTTGIAGLTLGGGIGWLGRSYGSTCDNLVSADVVTADGQPVRASRDENPDLFWGLRGGGGNFGVVTSFEYRLHEVGPVVLAGAVFHPLARARDALVFFREFTDTAPEQLTLVASFPAAPAAPFLPPEVHGTRVLALGVCHCGTLADAETAVAPLRAFGSPLADVVGPMPYTAAQTMFDERFPHGRNYYWKSSYLRELTDEAIDVLVDHVARTPSAETTSYVWHLGGAMGRSAEDTAFGHRDVRFDFAALAGWLDPARAEEHVGWAREFWSAMQPHASSGVYVNNLGVEGDERARAAYRPEVYDRLARLKREYDPDNFFRLNQNIRPMATS
ncbi:FAD-linked oxidase [Saccharothrix sp. ALI-22-I]|uniref:FAD-binding oxidoreductase n=1 Tax=Saccharothrix sp. ALI-22-I TaxID=1933778 RepID=UPI00097C0CF5|nr:FAD-binding oxidoreductase [Saccharothrix sp. ALI-22-I]ONI88076.1 FAD-linked oxidase [Saccharothrix sp. ALI-22-I]